MAPAEFQAYLHAQIPLAASMQVEVLEAAPTVVHLRAPLAPNINHHATVFGGSLSTLGILAAWSWLHVYTRSRELTPSLMIQREQMHYVAPAAGPFEARCQGPAPDVLHAFERTLERYRRARLELSALVSSEGVLAGRFFGRFVALNAPPPRFD